MKHLLNFLVFFLVLIAPAAESRKSIRKFDKEALEEYRKDPEFDYSGEYAQSGPLLSLFLVYIINKFFSAFNASGAGWLIPWVLRLLLVALIVYVIYFIIKSRYGPLFSRESKGHVPAGSVTNDGEKVDFDKLIQDSLQHAEYKLAIRYLFLRSLKQLNDQGDLEIRHWKAPYDYLKELPGDKRPFFRELTDLFEVTWYGEYNADEEVYKKGLSVSKQLIA